MHLSTLDPIDLGRLPIGRVSPEVAYYLRQSRAPKTISSYRWGWGHVLDICERRRYCPLPMLPEICCEIITELADTNLSVGSIRLVLNAIALAHRIAGERSPLASEAVRSTMRGIARANADRKLKQVAAITPVELRLVYDRIVLEPRRLTALRDWTLMIFGFAGAFRRGELVAIDIEDLEVHEGLIVVMIGRSKTDQEGRGASVAIHKAKDPDLCPVAATKRWLKVLPGPGPLFRPISGTGDHILPRRLSTQAVSSIIKRYAPAMGLGDLPIASHSLRAGFVTAALDAEIPDTLVMNHTRHKSHESLARYYRPRNCTINMTEGSGL
jgi:integrase